MVETKLVQTKLTRLGKLTVPDPNDASSSSDETHPPSKRQKVDDAKDEQAGEPKKKPRRRVGLENITEMNLDVLFYILGFLHPMDLLNVARTTKTFRRLLMHKSSLSIWKTARSQIEGLPDCPADLSEPQYAHLIFYPRCHGCDKVLVTIHWHLRARYCPSCRKAHLVGRRSYNWKDYPGPVQNISGDSRAPRYVADRRMVDQYFEELDKLPFGKRAEFVENKRREAKEIDEHARKCEAWHRNLVSTRRSQNQSVKDERADRIFERLEALGYGREILHFGKDRIRHHEQSVFNVVKPLRDIDWERIRPGLLKTMDNWRERRLERILYHPRREHLVKAYDNYVSQPAPAGASVELLPHVADVALFPPFDTIIKSPEGTHIDEESFRLAFDELPSLARQWLEDFKDQVGRLVVIPQALTRSTNPNLDTPKLPPSERVKLASAVFYFHPRIDCKGITFFPQQFARIFNADDGFYTFFDIHPGFSPSMPKAQATCMRSVRGQILHLFPEAAYIVRACGMDPETATREDMYCRNARLTCNRCVSTDTRGFREVFTWWDAILHASSWHKDETMNSYSKPRWNVIDDSYLGKIQAVEASRAKIKPGLHDKMQCAMCQNRVEEEISGGDLVRHLDARHGLHITINELQEGIHFKSTKDLFRTVWSRSSVVMDQEAGDIIFRLGYSH